MSTSTSFAVVLATDAIAFSHLWGMTLVERLLRQFSEIGIRRAIVLFSRANFDQEFLRQDFEKWTDISVETVFIEDDETNGVQKILSTQQNRGLVVDGRTVVDTRILDHLIKRKKSVRIENQNRLIATLTAEELSTSKVKSIPIDSINTYIQTTRKNVIPYLLYINGQNDVRAAEYTTFSATYKGATDFITKFVFFHPARWVVRLITPTGITPNQVTIISMLLSFGAIVPFFMGQYVIAVIMGVTMAFLDTVDGKLARVSMRTSKSGDLLDHVSDTVYLGLWFIGLGYSLSGGDLLDFRNSISLTHAILLITFLGDKLITGTFKYRYGYELHDYTPLDYTIRIFIARRNPFLLSMLIALLLGTPVLGLQIIGVWYVLTVIFHLVRFVYLPLSGIKHQFETD